MKSYWGYGTHYLKKHVLKRSVGSAVKIMYWSWVIWCQPEPRFEEDTHLIWNKINLKKIKCAKIKTQWHLLPALLILRTDKNDKLSCQIKNLIGFGFFRVFRMHWRHWLLVTWTCMHGTSFAACFQNHSALSAMKFRTNFMCFTTTNRTDRLCRVWHKFLRMSVVLGNWLLEIFTVKISSRIIRSIFFWFSWLFGPRHLSCITNTIPREPWSKRTLEVYFCCKLWLGTR